MNLSSLFYIYLFLPLCLLVMLVPKRTTWQNTVLLTFSLLFYAMGDFRFIWLPFVSGLLTFSIARLMERHMHKRPDGESRTAKCLLGAGIVWNLGALILFKYVLALLPARESLLPYAAPLGISFFSLRMISYLVDVSWEKIRAEHHLARFLLYTFFFPITVSGPITRYEEMQNALIHRQMTPAGAAAGFGRIAMGLGKKVILGDHLLTIGTQFLDNLQTQTFLGTWYGAIVYTLYVYFDFSGYCDIALGTAKLFGFELEENFRTPLMSGDITEFWQRWHISLGHFFRDYLLYLPIFGKRRKYLSLVLVWVATGLWHDLTWNYLIWGIYFCLILMTEMGIGKKGMHRIPAVVRHIVNKLLIFIGFGIFACTKGLPQIGQLLRNLFGFGGGGLIDPLLISSVKSYALLLIAAVVCCFPLTALPKKWGEKNETVRVTFSVIGTLLAAALLVISSILMVDATNTPFLYGNF